MRLTLHLDTFDRVNPMAFAILWLDNEKRQWSPGSDLVSLRTDTAGMSTKTNHFRSCGRTHVFE